MSENVPVTYTRSCIHQDATASDYHLFRRPRRCRTVRLQTLAGWTMATLLLSMPIHAGGAWPGEQAHNVDHLVFSQGTTAVHGTLNAPASSWGRASMPFHSAARNTMNAPPPVASSSTARTTPALTHFLTSVPSAFPKSCQTCGLSTSHRTAFIECQTAFEEAVTRRQQLATQRGILEEESGLQDLSTCWLFGGVNKYTKVYVV